MAVRREDPNEPDYTPSELCEAVLGILEDADVPTAVNDKVVKLIEAFECKPAEPEQGGQAEALPDRAQRGTAPDPETDALRKASAEMREALEIRPDAIRVEGRTVVMVCKSFTAAVELYALLSSSGAAGRGKE